MLTLKIIVASTRPGRIGLFIARWFEQVAVQHGKFKVDLVDLAEVKLPLFDEPAFPSQKQYQHEHTKKWSEMIAAGDAFALVTPEYNSAPTPALVNALDYLFHEWNYKPAGFVSYGGVSGGLRSAQITRQILAALKVVPLPEAVTIPQAGQQLQDGAFPGSDALLKASHVMLDELVRWAEALKPLRRP